MRSWRRENPGGQESVSSESGQNQSSLKGRRGESGRKSPASFDPSRVPRVSRDEDRRRVRKQQHRYKKHRDREKRRAFLLKVVLPVVAGLALAGVFVLAMLRMHEQNLEARKRLEAESLPATESEPASARAYRDDKALENARDRYLQRTSGDGAGLQ